VLYACAVCMPLLSFLWSSGIGWCGEGSVGPFHKFPDEFGWKCIGGLQLGCLIWWWGGVELWWAGGCQGVGCVFLWMSFLVWVTKIGDEVLAFVVWVWGLRWCAGVGVSVGYVGGEDVECPPCFLVQWGGVLVVGLVGGLGVVVGLLELDFVGLAPDFDLGICVVI